MDKLGTSEKIISKQRDGSEKQNIIHRDYLNGKY